MTPSFRLGGARRLHEWPLRHPGAAALALVLLATLGAIFAVRLPTERAAPGSAPGLRVRAELPGIAAAVVESRVTRPLENALSDLPGLREIEARTRAGRAEILLRFGSEPAGESVLEEVERRLAAATAHLPPGMAVPAVLPADAGTAPAVVYAVGADELSEEVTAWARELLADPLRDIRGASAVRIEGRVRREVLIQPDPERLAALGLGFDDLVRALHSDEESPQDRPLGGATITPASAEAIAARAVRLPNGEPIALAELARVSQVERARAKELRVTVLAASARPAVEIAERAQAHLAWLRANDLVPAGVTLRSLHDESRATKAWRAGVLTRLGLCVAVILGLLVPVFGVRHAGVAAVGFGAWLAMAFAALWLLGLALDLTAVAGVLLACVPFTLLMALPHSAALFISTVLGAAAFWAAGWAFGGAYAAAFTALAVAALLAAPVRWLLAPWLGTPEPLRARARMWPRSGQPLPLRLTAATVAAGAAIVVGVSLYALPGVTAAGAQGSFQLRLHGEDARRLTVIAGSLMPRLHAIPRVSAVASSASLIESWRLQLDAERMAALGLDLAEVGRAFAVARDGLIVGEIVSGERRIPVRLRLPPGAAGASYERLLLRGERAGAAAVYLGDLGRAERALQPRARLRLNGRPAVSVRARWRGRDARGALARLCRDIELPEGYAADCRIADPPLTDAQ